MVEFSLNQNARLDAFLVFSLCIPLRLDTRFCRVFYDLQLSFCKSCFLQKKKKSDKNLCQIGRHRK